MWAELQIYFGVALAGLVSFLSPCVLPLVPPYLGYLGGTTIDEFTAEGGVPATYGGACVLAVDPVRARLHDGVRRRSAPAPRCSGSSSRPTSASWRSSPASSSFSSACTSSASSASPLLYKEARYHGTHHHGASYSAPMSSGLAFAFGWTPCIGPILATVLALAANEGSLTHGREAAVRLFARPRHSVHSRRRRHQAVPRLHATLPPPPRTLEKAMGALLVITGLLFFTGSINWFGSWLLDNFPAAEPHRAGGDAQGSRHRDHAARRAAAVTRRRAWRSTHRRPSP